ncbi:MAG: Hsp20/alpha crystallin family protein [Caldimonas sp.]
MSDNTSVTKTGQRSTDARSTSAAHQAMAPAVDIIESEVGITLLADMPGVSKDRLTVQVDGENLTIEGRAQIDVPENVELLHSEVRSPYFRRTFILSRDLDPAKIEATLKNGMLQMHIPKSEQARPKRIEVQVA